MSAFADCRAKIIALSEQLKPELDEELRVKLETAMRDLAEERFDVAVMGEIKAGKSLLLNGLTERADLLPYDVNPWTAVITRLHFGHSARSSGGRFQFLSKEDWSALETGAEGRSFGQHLTGAGKDAVNMSDNVDPQTKADLSEVVARVKKRFGAQLSNLLGKFHDHDPADKVLRQYIASGEGCSDGDEAGKYVDIVQEAELFMKLEPFDSAVTLVDTPGTNDPFTLREDRTLKYISRAHAFVFVISAQAPFKAADEQNLRRLMSTLRKELIVIAVNRMDQVNEPKDVERVLARVRQEVAKRFPGVEIPVMPVSAHWANLAARADAEATRKLKNDGKLWETALYQKVLKEEDEERCRSSAGEVLALGRRLSGIEALRKAIDTKLLATRGTALLKCAANAACEHATEVEGRVLRARDQKQKFAAAAEQGREEAEAKLKDLRSEEEAISDFGDEVESRIESFQAELPGLASAAKRRILAKLRDVATDEAGRVRSRFSGKTISVHDERLWSCDLSDLRERLRATFDSQYVDESTLLTRQIKDFANSILAEVPDKLSDKSTRRRLEELMHKGNSPPEDLPSLNSLGARSVIDLGNWWGRWWSGAGTSAEKAAELSEVVRRDGIGAADGLAQEAEEKLLSGCRTRLKSLRSALDSVFTNRSERLKDIDRMMAGHQKAADPAEVGRQVAALRAEAKAHEAHGERLAALRKQIEALVIPEVGAN